MKYGIAIRNMGPQSSRKTIRECARIAEQTGFDALFVSDHLCIPPDQTEGSGGRYLDVLATLAFSGGRNRTHSPRGIGAGGPVSACVLTAKHWRRSRNSPAIARSGRRGGMDEAGIRGARR